MPNTDVNSTAIKREFYTYNAVGTVVANTDISGNIIKANDFDAFGIQLRSLDFNSVSFDGDYNSQNDLLFSTKERDASTGLDCFGFRYYDSEIGRFTTRDPSGYPDGANNQLYVNNNPINFIDPLGLRTESEVREEAQKEYDKKYAEYDEKYEERRMYGSSTSTRTKIKTFKGYKDGAPSFDDFHKGKIDALINDGYTIHSDDFSKVLHEPPAGVIRRTAAIIIQGGDSGSDHKLNKRMSKSTIDNLRKQGYDVNVIAAGWDNYRDKKIEGSKPPKSLVDVIKNAFNNVHKVGNVSIFAHMSNTLSLTNVDADITDKYYDSSKDAGDHKSYGKNLDAYRLHVKDFKVENATNLLNTICVYTCNKKAEVTLFSSLAKATQKNVYHVMSTYGLEVSKGRPMAAEKKLFHWSPIEKKFQITKPDGSTIQNLRAPKDAR